MVKNQGSCRWLKIHHQTPKIMRMRLPNGELAQTDEENSAVFSPHLQKVHNKHRPIDWEAVNEIRQRTTMSELDNDITMEELRKAISKLSNDKAPGLNGVPPNAFKCMDHKTTIHLFGFIKNYWQGHAEYQEWNQCQVVPVPKSGDLSDPNKWRGVSLMDIGSKIFSSILCERMFRILKKNGIKYQFGSTPGVGCQDGLFTIKTLLHLRHNHNLPTYVVFADLVKAFDTANHKLIVYILAKYGAPPNLCVIIERLYTDQSVVLKLGKICTEIPFTVGVKQGDSVAPVFFYS